MKNTEMNNMRIFFDRNITLKKVVKILHLTHEGHRGFLLDDEVCSYIVDTFPNIELVIYETIQEGFKVLLLPTTV